MRCNRLLLAFSALALVAWKPVDPSRTRITRDVKILMHAAGSDDLGPDASEELLEAALAQWQQIPCAKIPAVYGGRTSQAPSLEREGREHENAGAFIVGWEETDWPYAENLVALTRPRWEGGQIFAADIALNGVDFAWTAGEGQTPRKEKPTRPAGHVLAHELGHLLGFADSDVGDALMTRGDGAASSVTADDRDAACSLYPRNSERATDSHTTAPIPSHGCSMGRGPARARHGLAPLAALAAIGLAALLVVYRAKRRTLPFG